jgi:hypothetical protein
MKKMKQSILFITLMSLSVIADAQWGLAGVAGRTNSTVPKIGIGTFTLQSSILAKLHINSYLVAVDASTNGLMFRTDGDQTIENSWHLYTGTSATAQTERFRLFTQTGTTPFVGLRSVSNGFLFQTSGANQRMRINGTGTATINGFTNVNTSGLNAGISFVKVGNDFEKFVKI